MGAGILLNPDGHGFGGAHGKRRFLPWSPGGGCGGDHAAATTRRAWRRSPPYPRLWRAWRLAGFGDDLVEHRRAGELLPAWLGHGTPELIGAVRGPKVRFRLPVRDVHPPVLSVGGDGAVQPQRDEARLGREVPGGPGPQFVERLIPVWADREAVHQRHRPGEDVIGCRRHAILRGNLVRRHG